MDDVGNNTQLQKEDPGARFYLFSCNALGLFHPDLFARLSRTVLLPPAAVLSSSGVRRAVVRLRLQGHTSQRPWRLEFGLVQLQRQRSEFRSETPDQFSTKTAAIVTLQ